MPKIEPYFRLGLIHPVAAPFVNMHCGSPSDAIHVVMVFSETELLGWATLVGLIGSAIWEIVRQRQPRKAHQEPATISITPSQAIPIANPAAAAMLRIVGKQPRSQRPLGHAQARVF